MSRSSLFGTEFKVLGSLDTKMLLGLANFAFQSQHNLTSRFGLFVKDWFGLTTKPHLLGIVTAFALRKVTGLARLVLCHLVQGVLFAFPRAVGFAFFWNTHHCL